MATSPTRKRTGYTWHFVAAASSKSQPQIRRQRPLGVGKKLVEASVTWARSEKLSILPLCPFAKATFDKTPEWRDVLWAQGLRCLTGTGSASSQVSVTSRAQTVKYCHDSRV